MPAKKPAKPTRLQVKADKKDKVLTGPKGSKPQSTTTNRVRTQGGKPTVRTNVTVTPSMDKGRLRVPGTEGKVSKPAPSAGRRVNPKAAKPKPAPKPAAPKAGPKPYQVSDPWAGPKRASIGNVKPGAATNPKRPPQMVNSNSATMRQIQAKAAAARARAQGKPGITGPVKLPNSVRAGTNLIREGVNRLRNLADSGQVRAAAQRGQQAVEAAKRNRARLAAGVGTGAVERAAFKSGVKTGGRLLLPVAIASQVENVASGFKKLANHPFIKGRPKPATPKPAAPKGPTPAQRKDFAAQETKARKALDARKKATGSKEATPNTAASFDDAFKDARRAKVKTFTWRGKKYTTEMK